MKSSCQDVPFGSFEKEPSGSAKARAGDVSGTTILKQRFSSVQSHFRLPGGRMETTRTLLSLLVGSMSPQEKLIAS